MRVPTYDTSERERINLTPMIDVVFQLIVFFIATSSMARTEYVQEVEVPSAREGQPQVLEAERRKITLNVLKDGAVIVAGEKVSARQFEQMLAAEVKDYGAENIEVLIRADREAVYAGVEPYLLACARAGVWNVGFSVKRASVQEAAESLDLDYER